MADAKISALTNLTAADAINDMIPIVDVSDTPPASGNTKRISINNLLSSSPTASGALTVTGLVTAGSATITGAATVGTTLGVTGVSTFAAGTLSLPALTTTGDTNTGIFFPAADTFAVTTGGTERYRVDSSGNLGVGVAPSAWASGLTGLQIGSLGGASILGYSNAAEIGSNFYYDNVGYKYGATAASSLIQFTSGEFRFKTAASGTAGNAITFTQAMTLTAAGELLVGTTTTSGNAGGLKLNNAAGNVGQITFSNNSGSADYVARFNWGSTPTLVGNITVSSTATAYNTSSDYRLKESVKPLNGGLARVNALKPSVYKWKSDGSTGEGFLAHELAEVVPAAVTGEKDAVNADGSIKSQGIDMSRVVPILVAAIQELTAEVNALKNA